MLGRSAISLLLLLLSAPHLAHAQESSPVEALAQIREQVLYAQYPEAKAGLESFFERDDLDAASRNAALEVLVTIQIANRQGRRASATLSTLFARDPHYRLSESDPSPPVLSAFGRARENLPPPVEVVIDHEPPSLSTRAPPTLDVTIAGAGASAVQEVRLRYRQGSGGVFSTVVMNVRGDGASARLPLLDDPAAYDVEYLIEARAPSGAMLSSAGTEGAPLRFTVPEAPAGTDTLFNASGADHDGAEVDDDQGGSLAWLFITLAVLAVAAGVAVAVVLASSGGPEDGSLGNVGLPLLSF